MNPLSNINNPINSGAVLADAYGVSGTKAGGAAGIQGVNTDALPTSTNTVTKDDHGLVLSGRAERAQKIEAMAKDFFKMVVLAQKNYLALFNDSIKMVFCPMDN